MYQHLGHNDIKFNLHLNEQTYQPDLTNLLYQQAKCSTDAQHFGDFQRQFAFSGKPEIRRRSRTGKDISGKIRKTKTQMESHF